VESRVSDSAKDAFVEKFTFYHTPGIQVFPPPPYLTSDLSISHPRKEWDSQKGRTANKLGMV
jgi:hypothetical protein